jgi:hypothetical protein
MPERHGGRAAQQECTWKEHISKAFALSVVVLLPEIKTVENY